MSFSLVIIMILTPEDYVAPTNRNMNGYLLNRISILLLGVNSKFIERDMISIHSATFKYCI